MTQLFFDFHQHSFHNEFSFENFILFEENRNAYNLVKNFFSKHNFDENPHKIIIVEGDSCSGKSHLIKTFLNQKSINFINHEIALNQNPFLLFLPNNFFVIDDINIFKNDEKLLQIINCSIESKSMLALLCQKIDGFTLPDLKSRLKNFSKSTILQTNPTNLKLIFSNILSRKQIFLNHQIIDYIFDRITPKYCQIVYCAKLIEFYTNQYDQRFSIKIIDKILKQNLFNF